MKEIRIPLGNGINLVAAQSGPPYNREIAISLEGDRDSKFGAQNLAIVCQKYDYSGDGVKYVPDKFNVLVYSDSMNEDYTHKFEIDKYREEDYEQE